MKNLCITLCLLAAGSAAFAQGRAYTTANAHAHNDYEHKVPFYTAYYRNFGSIEADVFERNGRLFVAHNASDIDSARTLEKLYLQPLQEQLLKNGGRAFAGSKDTLQLLVDFKTAGTVTMQALLRLLQQYPSITQNPAVRVVISGNQPQPSQWNQYPRFIYFDGKREGRYTPAQVQRIPLYSANLKNFTAWNGNGIIVQPEKRQIQGWIDSVHQAGKKVRFWGAPDNVNAWKTMMNMGVDYIGTDVVEELASFLEKLQAAGHSAAIAPHTPGKARNANNKSLRRN